MLILLYFSLCFGGGEGGGGGVPSFSFDNSFCFLRFDLQLLLQRIHCWVFFFFPQQSYEKFFMENKDHHSMRSSIVGCFFFASLNKSS